MQKECLKHFQRGRWITKSKNGWASICAICDWLIQLWSWDWVTGHIQKHSSISRSPTQKLHLSKAHSQAYTSKRRILIEVLPVPNVYTKSANACIHTCIRRFGIHIGRRKYLNEYTPFTSVSLYIGPVLIWPEIIEKLQSFEIRGSLINFYSRTVHILPTRSAWKTPAMH